jgi:hypothetical protein
MLRLLENSEYLRCGEYDQKCKISCLMICMCVQKWLLGVICCHYNISSINESMHATGLVLDHCCIDITHIQLAREGIFMVEGLGRQP